jgi:D-alanine transaminase
MLVFLNGRFVAKEEARVSVDDRGFLFGDGIYEVIRARSGRLFEPDSHFARLAAGLEALRLPAPPQDMGSLRRICGELLERNELMSGDATIYLQITRGAAPRTHHFPKPGTPPTLYIAAAPFTPSQPAQTDGVRAITHPDIRWARCDLKTVNLLPNAWAKQCAVDAGAAEAVFVRDGVLTDGASSNVFAVIAGDLCTPPLSTYLLPGITRRVVLELAEELGLAPCERPIVLAELRRAEELFLTGTTTDVTPVVRLDDRAVGDGAPGPITRTLQHALAARLDACAERTPAPPRRVQACAPC